MKTFAVRMLICFIGFVVFITLAMAIDNVPFLFMPAYFTGMIVGLLGD